MSNIKQFVEENSGLVEILSVYLTANYTCSFHFMLIVKGIVSGERASLYYINKNAPTGISEYIPVVGDRILVKVSYDKFNEFLQFEKFSNELQN